MTDALHTVRRYIDAKYADAIDNGDILVVSGSTYRVEGSFYNSDDPERIDFELSGISRGAQDVMMLTAYPSDTLSVCVPEIFSAHPEDFMYFEEPVHGS